MTRQTLAEPKCFHCPRARVLFGNNDSVGNPGLAASFPVVDRLTHMAKTTSPSDLKSALLSAFATNNRINCYLVENVPAEAWTAQPPDGKGRTIAAMVAHIHNVRLMWLKAIGVTKLAAKLDKSGTVKDALKALRESHDALALVLQESLESGQVKGFKPDAASFYAYLIAHDAHHRGQISSLARQLGHPVSQSAMFGMWEWGSRAKEA
jgi:uncharacterized damage-inducible protein DinB